MDMDLQSITASAHAIASDADAIDIRARTASELKRKIAPAIANHTALAQLKSLLMIVLTAFPDPD